MNLLKFYPITLILVSTIYVVFSIHLMYELKDIDPFYDKDKLCRNKEKQRKANAIFYCSMIFFFVVGIAIHAL